jgi:hypothetical protein
MLRLNTPRAEMYAGCSIPKEDIFTDELTSFLRTFSQTLDSRETLDGNAG